MCSLRSKDDPNHSHTDEYDPHTHDDHARVDAETAGVGGPKLEVARLIASTARGVQDAEVRDTGPVVGEVSYARPIGVAH